LYSLWHYAITSWLRRGIPIHVVQKMAGHKHMSTTQRYVHHLKDAARRLSVGNMWSTDPSNAVSKKDQAA
jgi:site-specific recombinase XerD